MIIYSERSVEQIRSAPFGRVHEPTPPMDREGERKERGGEGERTGGIIESSTSTAAEAPAQGVIMGAG